MIKKYNEFINETVLDNVKNDLSDIWNNFSDKYINTSNKGSIYTDDVIKHLKRFCSMSDNEAKNAIQEYVKPFKLKKINKKGYKSYWFCIDNISSKEFNELINKYKSQIDYMSWNGGYYDKYEKLELDDNNILTKDILATEDSDEVKFEKAIKHLNDDNLSDVSFKIHDNNYIIEFHKICFGKRFDRDLYISVTMK